MLPTIQTLSSAAAPGSRRSALLHDASTARYDGTLSKEAFLATLIRPAFAVGMPIYHGDDGAA